jgi:Phosphatase-1 catalytic subunit binding region.
MFQPVAVNRVSKKKVTFSGNKDQLYLMLTWRYAYHASRKKYWEIVAVDRHRFERKIADLAIILNPILDVNHRRKIFTERMLCEIK